MKIQPNVNKVTRIAYLVMGLAFVMAPFVAKLSPGASVALPLLGVGAIATGATGF